MEKNIIKFGLAFNWAPRDWRDLSLKQMIRIFAAHEELVEERKRAMSEPQTD